MLRGFQLPKIRATKETITTRKREPGVGINECFLSACACRGEHFGRRWTSLAEALIDTQHATISATTYLSINRRPLLLLPRALKD
ncbi:hypothetical protein HBH56_154560 [Parastagonospora nodorum]|uniref:Uncharacterized protein n=1 Tax=Phaeosphaeria nodorum (strain SN15 / ATCC MYA-4574 / FGSC 10173) TaxID=321614 RepID=A0A7U2F1K4_PHANO|nr:hypothetical protein HBH56_154560 [Parastagonospora nodorum]QRC95928.1 hypothetical protein JI435_408100 [Parastagonospora nodorum SN15]KAH3926768.1 hypothetical protein HBH54_163130 [Parastagonospora nodorum]KAH3943219.1 hypothetical protein HBH53_176070 [Parastagonospora nodorum]KAH3970345.1 hypothetical protein HBH52_167740 [Parastagonospora nodorum]